MHCPVGLVRRCGFPALLLGLLLTFGTAQARPMDDDPPLVPVTLQLLWNHQFQFAGYYAAVAQGYYRDAGLSVEIRDGGYDARGHAVDPVEEVVFGRADFGTSRSDLLIHYSRGLPVALLACIMQQSPLVFLTLKRYGFDRLEAIGQRPVSLTLPSSRRDTRLSAETLAALKRAGIDYHDLNNHPPSWNIDDLLDGRTQLMPGYSTDAPYFIRQRGATPVEIRPADYGIDFYGQVLFTSQRLLETHPERAAAFREASLKGWRYAMSHREEIAEMILNRYGTRGPQYDKRFLLAESHRIAGLMQPDLIEIGYTNRHRWQAIADTYHELGLIGQVDLDGFLKAALPPAPHLARAWFWTLPGAAVLLGIAGIAGYLYATNRRLVTEIARRKSAETALRRQAERDGLTGLANRRCFEAKYHQAVTHAHETGRPVSLILFDVDHFKLINDTYGHLAGDRVLIEIARLSLAMIGERGCVARYGGEEFAILLPDTASHEARELGRRLCEAHRHQTVADGEHEIRYTLSLGIATLASADGHDDLKRRADQLLYRAKHAGRDTLEWQLSAS